VIKRIKVVGAGVVGLSTACVLAEDGYDVTVVAERLPSASTSAVAAAFWEPFHVGEVQPALVEDSYQEFMSLFHSNDDAGISIEPVYRYFANPDEQRDWERNNSWYRTERLPLNYRSLEAAKIPNMFACGVSYIVPVIHMPTYLNYLQSRLLSQTKQAIISRKVVALNDELVDADALINCTGLGSRQIADVLDRNLNAYRGQIVILPWSSAIDGLTFVTTGKQFEEFPVYVVPRRDRDIVLGGTFVRDESGDEQPIAWMTDRIIEQCVSIVPEVASVLTRDIPPENIKAGFRPVRDASIRLCLDKQSYHKPVIHNYGHGGGGVTLSWGCAFDVRRQLQSMEKVSV
jgi:D-amino-acid oxidase